MSTQLNHQADECPPHSHPALRGDGSMETYDVAVVGYGPVGRLLALKLGHA